MDQAAIERLLLDLADYHFAIRHLGEGPTARIFFQPRLAAGLETLERTLGPEVARERFAAAVEEKQRKIAWYDAAQSTLLFMQRHNITQIWEAAWSARDLGRLLSLFADEGCYVNRDLLVEANGPA